MTESRKPNGWSTTRLVAITGLICVLALAGVAASPDSFLSLLGIAAPAHPSSKPAVISRSSRPSLRPASVASSPAYEVVHSFDPNDPADGAHPTTALIEASDGKLYGATNEGGVTGGSTVFTMDAGCGQEHAGAIEIFA